MMLGRLFTISIGMIAGLLKIQHLGSLFQSARATLLSSSLIVQTVLLRLAANLSCLSQAPIL